MIASTVRPEWSVVLAALIRFTRNLELAEIAAEDTFAYGPSNDSVERLIVVGRAMALHRLRRDLTWVSDLPLLVVNENGVTSVGDVAHHAHRSLAYLAAHPGLPVKARHPLMLRLVCGLPVEEIALRLGSTESEIAQRLAEARRQIRVAGIPFEAPSEVDFAARMLASQDEPSCSLAAASIVSPAKSASRLKNSKPWANLVKSSKWTECVCSPC